MRSYTTLWNTKIRKLRQSGTFIATNEKSQGSVATHLMCGGMFNKDFIVNLLMSLSVKKKIGQHLAKLRTKVVYSVLLNWVSVYR